LARDANRIRAVRDAWQHRFMIDANYYSIVRQTSLREIEDCNLTWFESFAANDAVRW